MNETYNHIKKEFSDLVIKRVPKLDILNFYPYTDNVDFSSFIPGRCNLKKIYLHDRYKNKSQKDIVYSIIEDVARAMNYLMINGNYDGFDYQRIEAFALWKLFHNGICGWSKKNLKGLSEKEKIDLYIKCNMEADKLSGIAEKQKIKYDNPKYYIRKNGVYEITHKPLTQYSNTTNNPKIFYTKQQLAAIDWIVMCIFENLC